MLQFELQVVTKQLRLVQCLHIGKTGLRDQIPVFFYGVENVAALRHIREEFLAVLAFTPAIVGKEKKSVGLERAIDHLEKTRFVFDM